ncbi:histidinol-phosphate transaminase [Ornithinibacillus scapharcae]|uniref:histidinol-phosphate transaminase n=1 Tax=Ornithinibacillus scapharcae TaxID=1147159 RepID=UPI000225BF43|nr:histidinol-phosphate transaminase [Ornithinibacillus scapharcae]
MNKYWSSFAKRADPYIPGEQLNNSSIIKLNTNENPYPPAPSVIEAIQKELGDSLRLYPSPTTDGLRNVIAKHFRLQKENIFIGNGSDEVLAFSFMAFFEPGKQILFPSITYSFYPVYAKLFNIPYKELDLTYDLTINPPSYFHSDGGVIFPNPNAPTGIYLELDNVEAIIANNPDSIVIIDEAYIDFAQESAVPLIHKYPNLLVIQTTSKSKSLAGLRVGCAIGHPSLIEGLERIKNSFNSYTLDRLAIVGATAAWQAIDYYQQTTESIKETRKWFSATLTQLGFQVLPSQANFVFATHKEVPALYLYNQLKADNILVRHFNKQPINNYLRITIGTAEQMEVFKNKLTKIIRETKNG